ncbi:MAG: TspO/MBR family protein [Sphingomonadaceae bacterium]
MRCVDWNGIIALGASLGAVLTASVTGARYRPGPWYEALAKPALTPPNWVFPVVWGALYVAMAVAAWRVWQASGVGALPALLVYAGHLVLNAAWSWLFFGRKRIDLALAEILPFWLSLLATILLFSRHDPVAAWLMVPYIAWVTLAAILNLRFLQLNGPRGIRQTAWSGASPPAR